VRAREGGRPNGGGGRRTRIPSSALDGQGVASGPRPRTSWRRLGVTKPDSAPVLSVRVAAPLPDPLLHVLDHELKLFSRARRCQLIHRHAAITREMHLSLRRPAEPTISQPGVRLHPRLRCLARLRRRSAVPFRWGAMAPAPVFEAPEPLWTSIGAWLAEAGRPRMS